MQEHKLVCKSRWKTLEVIFLRFQHQMFFSVTFHLNLATDYLCFITTPPPADLVCMHEFLLRQWDGSGNRFITLPRQSPPPFLLTLVSILLVVLIFLGILYWRSCSTCPFTNRQREKTDTSLPAEAHSTSANTRIQRHRFYKQIDVMLFVVQLQCIIHGKL